MGVITILYEDSSKGKPKNFGPHMLVKQCICDLLNREPWELKLDDKLVSWPMNGNDKLRQECRKNMDRFAARGGTAFAVYDADKIRAHIKLPPTACKQQVVSTLKDGCGSVERLEVVLIERNMESVLEALRHGSPSLVPEVAWEAAVAQKQLLERDRIFNVAALPEPTSRRARDQLVEHLPSFKRLVTHIARRL
jgi:hypothetical protein